MSRELSYHLNVWLHILMAAVWVGGLIYTASVVVPFAVRHEPAERQRILRGLARRFRWIGWGSVAILILTGVGNLLLRYSPIRLSQLFNGEVFNADKSDPLIADWLPWKLILVAVMIALMAYHDITSIRAAKRHQGSPSDAPGSRSGSMAAAIATLIAIAVLYVSVRLVRG